MSLIRRWPCTTIFLVLLTVNEAAMIHVLVLPYPSTRQDWLFTTLFLAPEASLALLCAVMATLRITADVAAGIRRFGSG